MVRDRIINRLRWSLGSVTLIACHQDQDDSIIDTTDAAILHLQQALDMVRELNGRQRDD